MLLYIPFPTWVSAEIIPGLPFRWYGLMYLVAFAITYALFLVQIRERKLDVDKEVVTNFFFWGIIGLLIGARLFSTLLFESTGLYWRKPWLIFWPFDRGRFVGFQGMNYYGGLLGAVVGFAIYARVKKIDLVDWGDMLVAGIPLGYTFGRLGNFINGELFGRITAASWGVVFPHARTVPLSDPRVAAVAEEIGMNVAGLTRVNLPRHPTQIYEAILEGIVLWLIMWFVLRKRKPYRGFLIGAYVVGYGVLRFVIDYFRVPISGGDFLLRLSPIDNPTYLLLTPWNFIPSQLYSLIMIIAGAMTLVIFAKKASARAAGAQERKPVSRRKLRKRIK
jgi:phosphatidylglycerol:prolipoprotein diacylglycerol transferase